MPCLCWLKKSLNISLVDGFSIFQLTQFTFQDSRHCVQQGGFRSPFLLLIFIDIGFDSLSCVFCHLLREQQVKPCWWPLVNISLEKKDFTIFHWTLPELWVSTSARVLSIGAGSAGGSRTRARSCQSSIWTDIRLQTTTDHQIELAVSWLLSDRLFPCLEGRQGKVFLLWFGAD